MHNLRVLSLLAYNDFEQEITASDWRMASYAENFARR